MPMYRARREYRKSFTVGANGVATFAIPAGLFTALPIPTVGLQDPTSTAGSLSYKITSLTTTTCTIQVYRARLLPAVISLLTSLVNFDTNGGDTTGVIVNLALASAT